MSELSHPVEDPSELAGAAANSPIPFGQAPRPSTGRELLTRLREIINPQLPPSVTADLSTEMDGADITHLRARFGGTVRPEDAHLFQASTDQDDEAGPTAPVHSEPAMVRELTVHGVNFRVNATPVDFEIQARHLPVEWLTDADGLLWLGGAKGTLPAEADVKLGAAVTPVMEFIHQALSEQLKEEGGVRLTRLDVDFKQHGPRDITVTARARVSKFIALSGWGQARVRVTDDLAEVEVVDLKVGSRNPFVKIALLVKGKEITRYRGHRIPLAEAFSPMVLTHLDVQAGNRLRLHATFGRPESA